MVAAGVESRDLDGDWTPIIFTSVHIRKTSAVLSRGVYILKARNDHRSGEAALKVTHLAQAV